jgi:TPR repeat protein
MAAPEADQVQAATHLEKALAGGLPVAANILGRLYLEGAGNLTTDSGKARRALLRGAELLDPEAMKNLGVMYRQGMDGPTGPAQALKWYLAARETGWQDENLETTLDKLEGELEPQAVSEAKAGAKTWLEEHRTAKASSD